MQTIEKKLDFFSIVFFPERDMAMRRISVFLLQKLVPIRMSPLHCLSSRSELPNLATNSRSYSLSKNYSPTRRVGESTTPRFVESGSRFLIANISANSKRKSERLEM
jgi:hypothetical protein